MVIANKILTLVWDKNYLDAINTFAKIGSLIENGLTIPEFVNIKLEQETDKEANFFFAFMKSRVKRMRKRHCFLSEKSLIVAKKLRK